MKSILTRRSIRRFTAQPVSDEIVQDLLRAAGDHNFIENVL